MPRCRVLVLAACALLCTLAPRAATATYAPKVAVVFCQQTYDTDNFKSSAQMSSQALAGLAGLVGAPYDTVMLEQLLARPVGTYTSVWFSNCSVLADATLAPLASFLTAHLAQGGTVLLDGPLGAYGPPVAGSNDAVSRGSDATASILNVEALGWENVKHWTVRTASGAHPLAALPGWAPGVAITQGLADGTDLVGIANSAQAGSHVLLQVSNGSGVYPYLVATRPGGGRVLAVSSYANDAGAGHPVSQRAAPRLLRQPALAPSARRHLVAAVA